MKKLIAFFFQGLLYIAPIGITLFILYKAFFLVDDIFKPLIFRIFGFHIPGVGFIVLFLLITLLGFAGQTIIAKPIKIIINHFLDRAPLLKTFYTSIKDFLSAFVGKDKKFNQPVLVKVNLISDLEKIGFVTREQLSELGVEGKKVAVYFPHSYNFSGELFIVPADQVKRIDGAPADIMKFVVTGGVVSFKSSEKQEKI
ncbi:MAG: hypothetical protein A2X13_11385 [Bacteroidetes bacterium GWC2_33_15]|nr:MAG: hypothetical protein A2X10_05410 [Bacteroidetes bacterium GWA2_33_15]OFX50743.1 MAG: hypothetical protein A2X13_11385 [Bacteroidetes bacterium GWC2_33_15]OFX63074.1 MAG: hypothetical protein A2X15_09985 [Bacteroidetes bacterium GWB2_32_14]OFX70062.1 MAG: hypothetical protein A2X14_02845 [Bacteroidetes bacterium GWD2_33_33]